MKVLLVTGRQAKRMVERYAKETGAQTRVLDLPVSIAAFLSPALIAKELVQMDLEDFDSIIVPGLVRGDVSTVEKSVGIPTFKGPRYAADIPVILELFDRVRLSKVVPACELVEHELRKRAEKEIADVEERREEMLAQPGSMLVGEGDRSVAIGRGFPMRVIAEIVDATLLSNSQIRERARYYVESGADIVDLGTTVEGTLPEDAARVVKAAKKAVKAPISIDTMNPVEAEAAVKAGADLVLSVDAGNVADFASFASDVPVVVVPTNQRKGYAPKGAGEKVKTLKENIEEAKKMGIEKIIGDLILESPTVPGIVESLVAYHEFARGNPEVPLLFGCGNVTELLDADSIGINALLTAIAYEIGVALLFTTEGSSKTQGSVRELAMAAKMMFLARRRGSPPKDLGLDLLVIKDKRSYEEPYEKAIEKAVRKATVKRVRETTPDPLGLFKIALDRKGRMIAAIHYPLDKQRPDIVIKGKTAAEILPRIVDEGLVYSLDHAMYLGSELGKAEIALKVGKSYVQDSPLFP